IYNLCTHVAFGIYEKGYWVYVPNGYSTLPIEIPFNSLFFSATGHPVSEEIFESQAAAIQAVKAVGGQSPDRIAYYYGVGGRIICPTSFTYNSAPTIVNTASLVTDEYIETV